MIEVPHFMTKVDENTPLEVVRAMLLAAQRAMLASLEKEVLLENENALLKQKLFGKSSEKRRSPKEPSPALMPQVFDEAEDGASTIDETGDGDINTANGVFDDTTASIRQCASLQEDESLTQKPKKGRQPLPDHFPRENVIHDLPDNKKTCICGYQLSKIGEEVSERLEVIPAQLKVLRHIRYKYACRSCEEGVKIAPPPLQAIPKGIPTAGLLSHVCVAKFDDHLPLYRQSEIWDRMGVTLSRATLSSWVLKVGELLGPLIPYLRSHMIQTGYVRADESPTQVLREPGRPPTAQSYMWLYMTGNHEQTAIVYEYQETRKGDHAATFLKGFKGTLQTDGYSGYLSVTASDDVIAVGCWAHARRKFHDVWVVVKKEGVASKALEIIGRLYEGERELKEQNAAPDQIKTYRVDKMKPILEAFHTWLMTVKLKVPPKSPLMKAITYTLNQWIPLTRYIEDGTLSIDNNAAERQIRPFTIGRKNWLFMGSQAGAKAAAVIYSLIETAKANALNPEAYLRFILEKIPTVEEKDYHSLLPWKVELPPGYIVNST